jgi:solute carrier family 29 (equilibrative nucleoside transporter), member 1/2/3
MRTRSMSSTDRPRKVSLVSDIGYFAFCCFFWLGLGNLFPWNSFITAAPYFGMRFCGTDFESNFENFFSVSFMLAQTLGLSLAIMYGHMIPLLSQIYVPLTIYAAVFFATTILVVIKLDATLLFVITLISTFACGLCGAVLSGGLFGYAAVFPPRFTGALMSGQGLGGLTVALASFCTIWATKRVDYCSDDDGGDCEFTDDWSAFTFFMLATGILLSCIVAFWVLEALPFSKFYHERSLMIIDDKDNSASAKTLLLNEDSGPSDAVRKSENPSEAGEETMEVLGMDEIMRIFSVVKIPAFSVWMCFAVTIGLFPSITVLIESEKNCDSNNRFFNDLWVPFMFVVFNFFDLIGRLSAGSIPHLFTADNIWIPVVLRLVFFPLFLLCNVSGSQLTTVFTSDAWPIIFMAFFAASNG